MDKHLTEELAKKIAYDVCSILPSSEEKDSIVYYAILAAMKALKENDTLKEYLRQHPTLVEDLQIAAKRLGHGKNDILSCSLEKYAKELKEHDPQNEFHSPPLHEEAFKHLKKTNVEPGVIPWNKYPDVPFPNGKDDEDIQLLLNVDGIPMPYLTATLNKGTLFCFSTVGYPESPWTTLPEGIKIESWAVLQ